MPRMTEQQVRNHIAWARRIAANYTPPEGTDEYAAVQCMVDLAAELEARLPDRADADRYRLLCQLWAGGGGCEHGLTLTHRSGEFVLTTRIAQQTVGASPDAVLDALAAHYAWLPELFNMSPIDVTGGVDPADYVAGLDDAPKASLDWLYAQGARVYNARCEPDTRPYDLSPEMWDGSWELNQDQAEFMRMIGIGIQWPPCDDVAWARSALEWLRQGGIRVRDGAADWTGSEPQDGATFYRELSGEEGGKAQGLAAIVGKWPGDETDEEIEEGLAALRPPHPLSEQLDNLERLVQRGLEILDARQPEDDSDRLDALSRLIATGVVELQRACTCAACDGGVLLTVDGCCIHSGYVPKDLRAAIDAAEAVIDE